MAPRIDSIERFAWQWVYVLIAFAGLSPALAQEEDPGVEAPNVSILGTYVDPDDNRAVDDGQGLHILAGWALSDAWQIGLNTSYVNFDTGTPGTDFYRSAVGVDITYFLNPDGFAPFALASVGAVHNDVALSTQDHTGFTAGAGLGLLSPPFTDYGIRIRGEVRYVYDDALDKPEDTHFSLGVMFPLRKPRIVEVVQTEVQEREVIKEVYRDVPVPQQQQSVRDTDKDGVTDERDACPDTLAGADVDEKGCIRERAVIQLTGVYFEYNSSRLTENSKSILAMAAAALSGLALLRRRA